MSSSEATAGAEGAAGYVNARVFWSGNTELSPFRCARSEGRTTVWISGGAAGGFATARGATAMVAGAGACRLSASRHPATTPDRRITPKTEIRASASVARGLAAGGAAGSTRGAAGEGRVEPQRHWSTRSGTRLPQAGHNQTDIFSSYRLVSRGNTTAGEASTADDAFRRTRAGCACKRRALHAAARPPTARAGARFLRRA